MAINWGTKIVLGMLIFMLFILGMVIYMFRVHGRDALVEENYYEKGVNYNSEFNAKQNVFHDNAKPTITVTSKQIIIQLKTSSRFNLVLMKPSNSDEDLKFEGNTFGDSNLILVDKTTLSKGLWFIKLEWHANNTDYLFKNNITL